MGDINTPQLVESATDGPVTGGDAAKKCTLTGGVFNTQLPVPTNGQQVALQLSSSGRLLTDSSGTTQPVTGNIVAISGEVEAGIVHHYGTVSSVATGAIGTISYTVSANKMLYIKAIQAASSGGPCKVQLQSDNKVYATTFYSASVLHAEINFPQPISFPEKSVVSITIQNNAFSAQDVCAFINGHEIPARPL